MGSGYEYYRGIPEGSYKIVRCGNCGSSVRVPSYSGSVVSCGNCRRDEDLGYRDRI